MKHSQGFEFLFSDLNADALPLHHLYFIPKLIKDYELSLN